MIYQSTETTIPISVIILKNNGTPDTGKNPTITLFNETLGTRILNDVIVPEDAFGLYTYEWTHGLTINSDLIYFIKDGTDVIDSGKFRIVTVQQEIEAANTASKNEILADINAKKDLIIADALANLSTILADALSNKDLVLADILAKKDIIVADALSNKNELITEMDTNTLTITTDIADTKTIINENIDDSDGRVS
jgi:hypothetical protein